MATPRRSDEISNPIWSGTNLPTRVRHDVPLSIRTSTIMGGSVGMGLFCDRDVQDGELIFAIKQPLIAVACQEEAWNHHHKYECRTYAKCLESRVASGTNLLIFNPTFRMLARLVCLHDKQKLKPEYSWREFERLATYETHRSQVMELPVPAAILLKKVTNTTLSHEQIRMLTYTVGGNQKHMAAPVIRGSQTWLDPLMDWGAAVGYCLEPFMAVLQHSCTGNVYVMYESNELRVRALRDISKDEELLIPWVEISDDRRVRLDKLIYNWNLTCRCDACRNGPTMTPDLLKRSFKLINLKEEKECLSLLPDIESTMTELQSSGLGNSQAMRRLVRRAIAGHLGRKNDLSLTKALKLFLKIYYVIDHQTSPPTRRLEHLATMHDIRSLLYAPLLGWARDVQPYPERIKVLLVNIYPYWCVKIAEDIRLAFGADSAACRVEQRWRDEVLHYFNIPGHYDTLLADKSLHRRYVDISQDLAARRLFVKDVNALLAWAGIPTQTYEQMMR
ncbi:uncharacterized protein LY89DRAFT_669361 [Mollisia scopiformis]|uniref:SET domain-containing protein n=1 Tax=Mollisia scopiformis TaxID=149040 RepID=A0A194X9R6_MOLSC|nr:uncharacterized protein LY89DRAFT_669361 [Mollisia scopiformis]KUJ16920.1 hypothetical protein LY89DRAFT_669361 [Mollisia scopiformis]